MSSWEGKSRGNKTGYRIFVWILRNFGVQPAYFLLRFVAFYFFLFSPSTSRQLYDVYHRRLRFSRLRSLRTIFRNYYLLGQSLIDKVVVMGGIRNRFTFDFDGEENLHSIAAMQQGGMLISAHLGNWDIAGHLLKRIDTRIHIVIFDGEYQKIKDYLSSVTGNRVVNLIIIRDDLSHIYAINDAFRNNELVCMHADRFLPGNKTMTANLLNSPAPFPLGPFVLAVKFKVPVSFVFALKESDLHYHFFAGMPRIYDNADRSLAMQQMLEDFTADMDAKLRTYPAQWFNYHNFWQTT